MPSAITLVRGNTDYRIPLSPAELIQIERVADARNKQGLRHRLEKLPGVVDVDYDSELFPGTVFFSLAPDKDTPELQNRICTVVTEYLELASTYPQHQDASKARRRGRSRQ